MKGAVAAALALRQSPPCTRAMNRHVVGTALIVFGLLVAGCESMSDATSSVRERMAARDPVHAQTYPAEQRPTYEAVRTAATQMGYRFLRGGPAQGEFEAVSAVGAGERMGSARQLAMKVKLQPASESGTNVSIKITEIIEADSSNRAGQATQTPLRDTPQYEVFFRRVGEALEAARAPQK
jgi:hypothetical protein